MIHLANKKISSFSLIGHGFFFWNFRTDLNEPQWSYLLALERGWIPVGSFNDPKIQDSCRYEDDMAYKCILKRDIPEKNIIGAVQYILGQKGDATTLADNSTLDQEGKELRDSANDLISEFFDQNKGAGVTCDFGGIAMLVEENRTIADDDYVGWNDDAYFHETVIYKGPSLWQWFLIIGVGIVIGSFVGFVVGMHTNKGFNRAVQKSRLFSPLSRSKNQLVRSSLALDALDADQILTNEEANLLHRY